MEKTDFKTGWGTKAWIEVKKVTTYAFYDEMKCSGSGKKLENESLFVLRQNFKHRRNETDETFHYNRESTYDKFKEVWDEWDKEKQNKKEEIRQIADQYNLKVNFR